MYALIVDGVPSRYPYTATDLIRDNPSVSFPSGVLSDALLAEWGVVALVEKPKPAYDSRTQKVVPAAPIQISGKWTERWQVVAMTPEETSQAMQALQASIVSATEQRLDSFAQTRNYDDIKSASDYAGCSVLKFSVEGQYCKDKRAETWARMYQLLAEIQSGTRPVPRGYEDIESELPVLAWPE